MPVHATPQPIDHLGPVRSCPGCGGRDFQAQEHDETVVFVCIGCETAWRYELGYVWPVDKPKAGSLPPSP